MEKITKKRIAKRLVIHKETVRTLNESSLKAVAGGLKPETRTELHCTGGGGCGPTTM